jgi:hypothetical protein
VIVTDKEMEALLFVMDDAPLIAKLMGRRNVPQPAADRAIRKLRPFLAGRMLPGTLNIYEQQVIAACIEDSDWPLAYAEHRPEELDTAHTVLRTLARKVERLGIEVSRIAHA